MTRDDERFERVANWALDHCAAQVNLDATLVVVGDPEIIWSAPPLAADALGGDNWALIDLPAGRVLLLKGEAREDGPWLFVTTTSDGPIGDVTIQPTIWTNEESSATCGWVTLTSGRLVAGEPVTVRAWGPTVDVEDGEVAQSRTGYDLLEPKYVGAITVVRVPSIGACPVDVARTSDGKLHALVLRFSLPTWTPPILHP